MSSSNCCFLACMQISQEADQVVWYSHLFQNFPQFTVIHTVKGFGTVKKAETDVFLELSCFFHDPADVGNLFSGSSAFSKTSLKIWWFMIHVLLKPGLENFEHYFTTVWSEVIQSCLTFCNPMDCSLPGSSVLGILQERKLEWIVIPLSRGSSQPRDRTQVSCIAGRLFTIWATREAHSHVRWVQLYGSLNILWHCLSLGLEWKLTFSSPVATLGTENSAKQGNSWSSHYSRRDK